MESLLCTLKQQTEKKSMSVGDLTINKRYLVERFTRLETKFGGAILCALYDEETGGVIEVFLPKCVQLSEVEVDHYNTLPVKELAFKYQGKLGRSFKIAFERL